MGTRIPKRRVSSLNSLEFQHQHYHKSSPAQKSGGPDKFYLLVSRVKVTIYMHYGTSYICIKHFSADLRKSQEGSGQKCGSGTTYPPMATPLSPESH